jgi:hypothetical protein
MPPQQSRHNADLHGQKSPARRAEGSIEYWEAREAKEKGKNAREKEKEHGGKRKAQEGESG